MFYRVNDTELKASDFIAFANKIWKGNYDLKKTREAHTSS